MQFPLTRARSGLVAAFLATIASGPAAAESAYIQQSQATAMLPAIGVPVPQQTIPRPGFAGVPAPSLQRFTPEASVAAGNNLARTLQIGALNQVAQIQAGANNVSTVGVIAGQLNNVGVVQAGNNLRSNLVLLNTQGLSVGVLQPNGSAPVNMLIARLPNGALLIKR
ncbi:hypothetical protein [Bosea sp. BK604]|uniref:hypothetical protein n=1 Tax=Bosea sp. BK604 TaxID=2512180 RepID=UPI0010448670|nr:hypothetical protein [Bosea sp. BK604]TCR63110.1 hypothetical protein EV560_109204 [Bosea sp. BK604]